VFTQGLAGRGDWYHPVQPRLGAFYNNNNNNNNNTKIYNAHM